MLPYQTIL